MSDVTRIITNQHFYGGMASDPAIGTEASFSYGRAIDHRSSPSQLSVLPGPRKISGSVVVDLIMNMQQVKSGDRYAYGKDGNVYKISTSNVVTQLSDLGTGSDGMLYREDTDAIYFATQTDIRRYYPVSGAPTFDQTYAASASSDSASYKTGGAQVYTVPTSLTEADKCSFQPDIEPFYSIKVKVVTKGAGDLVLTLHDGINSVLATVTIPNASITAAALNEFVFSSQIRGLVKPNARTYHWHVHSTAVGTTIQTSTVSDVSTADYEVWAYRLVDTVNDLHPMAQFLQYTIIGNGNYLAVWEPLDPSTPSNSEFQRHRLTFPSGFEVCGIAVTDEFAVIATEKRSSDSSKDFQEGKLFIWDGVAQTYNQVIDIAEGSPEGIQSHENYPHFVASGTLYAWPGGKNIVPIRQLANTDTRYTGTTDATRVYPNMLTVRRGLLHVGYPSLTNNVALEHGVHTWGSLEKNYPASWGNLDYCASAQETDDSLADTAVQLGCVKNFGDEMYISWYDGSVYGLDIVDADSTPARLAKWRARRFDAGAVYKEKKAEKILLNTSVLAANVAITPTYRFDDDAEVDQTEFAMAAADYKKISILDGHLFRRVIVGFDITCGAAVPSSPIIYGHALEWNPLADEKDIG